MDHVDRISRNPGVMGGKPCVRGMRVTVGMIIGPRADCQQALGAIRAVVVGAAANRRPTS